MKNIFKKLPFLLSLFALACTETNDVVAPGDKPIITAYLAPGHPISMTVKSEIPYTEENDGTSKPINGLAIKITSSTGQVFNLKSDGEGKYSSAQNELVGETGTIYTLRIEYNGRLVTGSTVIPPKTAGLSIDKTEISRTKIDLGSGGFPGPGGGGGFGGPGGGDDNTALKLSWSNPENAYYFLAVESAEASPELIVTLPSGFNLPNRRFTNSPVVGTSTNVIPNSFSYFGKYHVILYRVGTDYAALYRSSGTTTQNISTPPTSIENGLGIFTGINADTLQFIVKKK